MNIAHLAQGFTDAGYCLYDNDAKFYVPPWAVECPDIWQNTILCVSVRLFLDKALSHSGGQSGYSLHKSSDFN